MQKILLFGTGFIATNLIEYFTKKDNSTEFIVIYNEHKIQESTNIKQYSMSANIEEILKQEQPDYAIILHGESFVSNNSKIEESIQKNVLRTSAFLESLNKVKASLQLKKILIVGSASEYGKLYNQPIKEDFELHPTSIYGLSKIFLFNVAKYFIARGLPIVYARQFNAIGVGQRENFVFSSFCKNIISIENGTSEPTLRVGDLSQERDFLDVRDVSIAYDLLLQKGEIGETYNVGSGESIEIGFLLESIIEESSLEPKKIKIIQNKELFLKEESLSKRLLADVDKLKQLGFEQKYTLKDTIKNMLNHGRKNV